MNKLFIGIIIFSSSFTASAMRCNGNLITEGDAVSKVFKYCGTPTWQQNPGAYGDASIWQYSMDDGMTYTLLIKQGIVYSIDYTRS